MCRKIGTITEAAFALVGLDETRQAARRFDEQHCAAAEYLDVAVRALRSVRPDNDLFAAMTRLEMSAVGHARDIVYAVWASIEDRRNEKTEASSRCLSRGMKVTVVADIGQPEDVEFPASGVRATVIAVDGETALLTFTVVEGEGVHRYYLETDTEFQIPAYYDGAGDDQMKVTVHCSPDLITWALDLDQKWKGLMTDSGRKVFSSARKDCERTMAAAQVKR